MDSRCEFWREGAVKGLSREDRAFLQDGHQHRLVARHELAFQEGNPPEGIYGLAAGSLRLFKSGYGGHTQILRLVWPGELMGYRSLFAGEGLSASAEAREPSKICVFRRDLVFEFVQRSPQAARVFLNLLSLELGKSRQELLTRNDQGAAARLARCLLAQPRGPAKAWPSRGEMADMIGATPETVSRLFHRFREEKLLTARGRRIQVQDRAGLEAIADMEKERQPVAEEPVEASEDRS